MFDFARHAADGEAEVLALFVVELSDVAVIAADGEDEGIAAGQAEGDLAFDA